MPNRDRYLQGTPSWVDLATTDVDGSRAFYTGLFGWEWEANETDQPDNHYHMGSLAGRAAAGMMQQAQEQVDMGLPPLWNVYITVDDVDATVDAVAGAGGAVMAPAFDVMDAGRMAVIVDPTGAVVCLWQPKEHPGCEIVNEPGAFTWAELVTADQPAAAEFYGKVLGVTSSEMEMEGLGTMTTFEVAGEVVGSAMPPQAEGVPPMWTAYFAVDDCDAACAKVTALGGQVVAGPFDAAPGRIAAVTDPAGAHFSIIALAEPPPS
jgi:predicted enzyme related to lactoylglutathione lyase